MINQVTRLTQRLLPSVLCAAVALSVTPLSGCVEDAPPPPPPAPPAPPPPPPPPPQVKTVDELRGELGIDPKVSLPESLAPETTEKRVAVLKFMNSFATGDAASATAVLAPEDAAVLAEIESNGAWRAATAALTKIECRCGKRPEDGRDCLLAIMIAGDNETPTLWNFTVGDSTAFAAEPTPPGIMNRLSGEDWIEAWYKELERVIALANEPDEVLTMVQVKVGEATDTGQAPPEAGGGGGGGGRAPMRRQPGG